VWLVVLLLQLMISGLMLSGCLCLQPTHPVLQLLLLQLPLLKQEGRVPLHCKGLEGRCQQLLLLLLLLLLQGLCCCCGVGPQGLGTGSAAGLM
jgi:hypothetical protein